jgi:predicted lipoprotein
MFLRPIPAALALCLLALPACKFVDTAELAAKRQAAAAPTASASGTALYAAKVVPYVAEKAAPYAEIRKGLDADFAAGAKTYGYREVQEGAPFNFLTRVSGTIVSADTKSRAATALVDTDGDGTGDVTLQLGPVIKGTSLRDALPFVTFTSYANQIEFADVAKAFNTQAYETALKALPREALVGQRVEALGAFTLKGAKDKVLVTPVEVRLGAGA